MEEILTEKQFVSFEISLVRYIFPTSQTMQLTKEKVDENGNSSKNTKDSLINSVLNRLKDGRFTRALMIALFVQTFVHLDDWVRILSGFFEESFFAAMDLILHTDIWELWSHLWKSANRILDYVSPTSSDQYRPPSVGYHSLHLYSLDFQVLRQFWPAYSFDRADRFERDFWLLGYRSLQPWLRHGYPVVRDHPRTGHFGSVGCCDKRRICLRDRSWTVSCKRQSVRIGYRRHRAGILTISPRIDHNQMFRMDLEEC